MSVANSLRPKSNPAPAMVRVALAPHPLLLVTVVVAVCAAIPHAVMAIDLSRLYGHLSSKRNGKTMHIQHLLALINSCVAVRRSIIATSSTPSFYYANTSPIHHVHTEFSIVFQPRRLISTIHYSNIQHFSKFDEIS